MWWWWWWWRRWWWCWRCCWWWWCGYYSSFPFSPSLFSFFPQLFSQQSNCGRPGERERERERIFFSRWKVTPEKKRQRHREAMCSVMHIMAILRPLVRFTVSVSRPQTCRQFQFFFFFFCCFLKIVTAVFKTFFFPSPVFHFFYLFKLLLSSCLNTQQKKQWNFFPLLRFRLRSSDKPKLNYNFISFHIFYFPNF